MPNIKILVIDDEKDVCNLVEDMLSTRDYITITAEDAETGIKKAEAEQPNLILLDITMPGADGFSALNRLKSNPNTQDIPVVMLSGRRDYKSMEEAEKSRAKDYIMKPFDTQELLKVVNRSLSLLSLSQRKYSSDNMANLKNSLKNPICVLKDISDGKDVSKDFVTSALNDLLEIDDFLE